MLQLDITPLVRLAGGSDPMSYLINHGMSRGVARGIVTDPRRRWDPDHISWLCDIFHCTVDPMIRYVGNDPNHPMAKLERPQIHLLQDLMKGLTPEEQLRAQQMLLNRRF